MVPGTDGHAHGSYLPGAVRRGDVTGTSDTGGDAAGVTYRPVPEDRRDEFDAMVAYAFSPTDGPPDGAGDEAGDDDPNLGDLRGMFDGDRLRAVCRHHYWPTTVRGATVELAGLSAVASPPESRRQGLVGRLLGASLEEYRAKGCPLAALWPFDREFYARYGWGTANARAVVTCEPEALATFDADGRTDEGYGHGDYDPGEFRRLDPDEWGVTDAVYREHAAGFDLSIERDEAWWRQRRFDSWSGRPHVYAVERGGDPCAYAIYEVEDGDSRADRTLTVFESAWTDDGAFRDLLRFAYYHDSQVGTVELHGRAGGRLRDLPDCADVEFERRGGPMVRVVDVVAALEAVEFPHDETVDLTLSVSDPLVERNDGRFLLSVQEGTGRVERLGDRTPTGSGAPEAAAGDESTADDAASVDPDPDLHVDCSVAALSELVVGYRSAPALSRVSDLRVSAREPTGVAAGPVERLGALFPPRPVYLRDFF